MRCGSRARPHFVHEENAGLVARHLSSHPAVSRVWYPGLEDHPGHELARRQQAGFGAMIAFELAAPDGDAASSEDVAAFLAALQCFSLAESLGGVESLVCHPATMTHAAMDAAARARAGISDRLLRLSIGIEAAGDLVADLDRALAVARATSVATRSRSTRADSPASRPAAAGTARR